MIYGTRRMTDANAESEQLLAQVDATLATAESESAFRPHPMVLNICRQVKQESNRIRRVRYQVQRNHDPRRRQLELRLLRNDADRFVRRWVNQLLRYIPHMHRKDIDGLVGCLAAVENAVGIALPAMGPLRAAARQRGMQGI